MFSIGEFSKVTGLTVKTLRYYQEQGLLEPAYVNEQTGYRYYHESQAEAARLITWLRTLELPIAEIREILALRGEDAMVAALEKHRDLLQEKIKRMRAATRSLDHFIATEREAQTMEQTEVREKMLEPQLVAAIRMRGRYSECGKAFATLGRRLGRYLGGKPMLLHYDEEYKEADADFEACIPLRKAAPAAEGIAMRELPGGRCVVLLHKGPYEQMGRSYAEIFRFIHARGYKIMMPTREVYLKGPGMFFKGNPQNYLTEIEILVEPAVAS